MKHSVIYLAFITLFLTSCMPGKETVYGDYYKKDRLERNGFSQSGKTCTMTVKNKTQAKQYFTVDEKTYTIPAAWKWWIFTKKGKVKINVSVGKHYIADNVFDETNIDIIPAHKYEHLYYGDAMPSQTFTSSK